MIHSQSLFVVYNWIVFSEAVRAWERVCAWADEAHETVLSPTTTPNLGNAACLSVSTDGAEWEQYSLLWLLKCVYTAPLSSSFSHLSDRGNKGLSSIAHGYFVNKRGRKRERDGEKLKKRDWKRRMGLVREKTSVCWWFHAMVEEVEVSKKQLIYLCK